MSAKSQAASTGRRWLAKTQANPSTARPRQSFRDYHSRIAPKHAYPEHLQKLVSLIERHRNGEEIRAVFNAPPRHWKTETCMKLIAWLLQELPHQQHAYATYSMSLSKSKSRAARNYARSAGAQFSNDSNRLEEWTLSEGGGLLAVGVDSGFTGKGVSGVLLIDDPVKNRVEAESIANQEKLDDWLNDVAYTRLEPGASALLFMTRWTPKDLAQRCIDMGWEYYNLPAMGDDDVPLLPDWFPAEKLQDIRETVGEYTWSSLYQGRPRARGGSLFENVHTYDALPVGARFTAGGDFAYTAKKTSDYSVVVVMAHLGDLSYIVDVVRKQVRADAFEGDIRIVRQRFPTASWRSYIAGTERGVVDMWARNGVGVGAVNVAGMGDKFVRAQPMAAAWNAGKVLVPAAGAPWLDAFLSEVCSFTGVNDANDDQLDAAVGAFDAKGSSAAHFVKSSNPRETRDIRSSNGGPRGLSW